MPPRSAPKPKKGKKALKKKIIETRSTGKEPAAKATTVKTVQTDIKWNDEPQLSLGLVAAITDNPDIKQGLFPSPGGNVSTAKGGGTKKITWQWQLAEIIFKDHKKYGAELRKALDDSGLQKAWAEKIKNRLKTMTQTTQKHIEALGKTGAGISRVEEIDLSKDNRFTTQWKLTAVQCPYFFEMRELIGECPNLIRTGIGNSTSDIDLDILQDPSEAAADAVDAADPGDDDADVSEGPVDLTDGDRSTSEGVLYDSLSKELDTTDDDEADLVPPPSTKDDKPKATLKRKAASSDAESANPKTGPRADSSKPATKQTKAKKTKFDEFNMTAQAEEATRQKEIDLTIAKVNADVNFKIQREKVTVNAQLELARLKAEKEKQKIEAKREITILKMRQQHELRQQQIRMRNPQTSFSAHTAPPFQQQGPELLATPSLSVHPMQHQQPVAATASGMYAEAGPSNLPSAAPSSSYSGHSSPMTFADPADFPNNFHTGYGDVHQQMTYPQVNITANSGDDMGDDMYVEEGI